MSIEYPRRDFLKQAGSGLLGLGLLSLTGGCESLLQTIRDRPVRRIINNLATTDPVVQMYQAAVSAMKALPSSDPRNWTRQAEIHLDHCPHGNWFFLPWHRAYLFYFEQICRELIGDDSFALPYWNWTMRRSIPPALWGSANPLFNATRSATSTSEVSASAVGESVMEGIFSGTDFELFASYASTAPRGGTGGGYGQLEATPHNNVHGFVGGDMGGYMSPLDPVFWTHHNMIDCCWAHWNIDRENPNTNDTSWTQYTFTGNFFNGTGSPVDIQVVTTILMPLLSYRFEESRKGEEGPRFVLADLQRIRRLLEAGTSLRLVPVQRFPLRRRIEVVVGQPVSVAIEVEPGALRSVLAAEAEERLILRLGGVEAPAEEDFFVRVFVEMPDATGRVPIEDPHFAGSFAFFVEEQHREHLPQQYNVDVTDAVRRLAEQGAVGDLNSVSVQLVAVPVEEGRELRARSFALDSLELMISRFSEGGQER